MTTVDPKYFHGMQVVGVVHADRGVPSYQISQPDEKFNFLCIDAENVEFSTDLPGVRKEDISIRLVDGQMIVSAQRLDNQYTSMIERSVNIGFSYDASSANATFELGVLRITMKRVKGRLPHLVTIK